MRKIIHSFLPIIFISTLLPSCGKKTEETKPIRIDITETVFASGVLEANGLYNLTARADGYLESVNFSEGDLIKKGTVLAVINNEESIINNINAERLLDIAKLNASPMAPALRQAEIAVETAKQKKHTDSLQFVRYSNLLDKNSIAKTEYESILLEFNTSKANLLTTIENHKNLKIQAEQQLINSDAQNEISSLANRYNELRAITNGKVYKKLKQTGDYIKKGEIIASIGDPNYIYAKVNIDENNINKIRIGNEAVVQLNTNKSISYKAKVAELYPSFDEASQSFICKLIFTNPIDFTIIGTQLQANITVGIQKDALIIPRNFIDFGGNVMLKGQKHPTKVTTQFISNNWVQILNGIDESSILVTETIAKTKPDTSEVNNQMKK